MSSLVYATGHIQDPVPLIEKRRGVSPGDRFPPRHVMTFIMQVEILTYLCHTYDARTPDFMNGDITIAITLNVKK